MSFANSDDPTIWPLIDQIYETGQSPHDWPLLIDGLLQYLESAATAGEPPLVDLAVHFEQALRLNSHLGGVADDPAFLKSVRFPMLVVDRELSVSYVSLHNPPFMHPSGPFRVEADSLEIADELIAETLADLFVRPGREASAICLCDLPGADRVYALPLTVDSETRYVGLLWASEDTTLPLSGEHLQALYGLTPAEALLARTLTTVPDTRRLAAELKIAEDSVRTQLKRIYLKTGTGRKAELVAKILCGPALLAKLAPSPQRLFDEGSEARRNQTLELEDGRVVGFAEYGAVKGQPLLCIHNLIGSRMQLPAPEVNLIDQNVRLIVPDRPGVGLSSRLEPFTFERWSEDMSALARSLDIERVSVLGSSLGSVYALALARHQPEFVRSVAAVSCVPELESLRGLGGLPAQTQSIFMLARTAPRLLGFALRLITRKGPQAYLDQLICELPAADRLLYEDPGFHQMMVSAIVEAMRQGSGGFLHDLEIMATKWSFDVGEITRPVQFWHGEEDTQSPPSLVRPVFERVPRAKVQTLPRESHWLLFRHWNTIVASLLAPDRHCDITPHA